MADTYKEEEKIKHLLEVIKRIDAYILSTNQKCAIVISYCAAVVGWMSININKIMSEIFAPLLFFSAAIVVALMVISSCYCIYLAVGVLLPVTKSSDIRSSDVSVIYYGDIADTPWGGTGYVAKLEKLSQSQFLADLTLQVFTLSTIADVKFSKIQRMTTVLNYTGILPLGIFMLILLANTLITWTAK